MTKIIKRKKKKTYFKRWANDRQCFLNEVIHYPGKWRTWSQRLECFQVWPWLHKLSAQGFSLWGQWQLWVFPDFTPLKITLDTKSEPESHSLWLSFQHCLQKYYDFTSLTIRWIVSLISSYSKDAWCRCGTQSSRRDPRNATLTHSCLKVPQQLRSAHCQTMWSSVEKSAKSQLQKGHFFSSQQHAVSLQSLKSASKNSFWEANHNIYGFILQNMPSLKEAGSPLEVLCLDTVGIPTTIPGNWVPLWAKTKVHLLLLNKWQRLNNKKPSKKQHY